VRSFYRLVSPCTCRSVLPLIAQTRILDWPARRPVVVGFATAVASPASVIRISSLLPILPNIIIGLVLILVVPPTIIVRLHSSSVVVTAPGLVTVLLPRVIFGAPVFIGPAVVVFRLVPVVVVSILCPVVRGFSLPVARGGFAVIPGPARSSRTTMMALSPV